MKPLIAIITCHKFRSRADAQRQTWIPLMAALPEGKRIDVKFFLGQGEKRSPGPDEVFLNVEDTYESLPFKVHAALKWAVAHGYDAVLKCDDDVYIVPNRLNLPNHSYVGRINKSHRGACPNGWCSGFAYWLTGQALQIVVDKGVPDHSAEDLWVGTLLNHYGVTPYLDSGFIVLSVVASSHWSRHQHNVVIACEFFDSTLVAFHKVMTGVSTVTPAVTKGPPTYQFGRIIRKA